MLFNYYFDREVTGTVLTKSVFPMRKGRAAYPTEPVKPDNRQKAPCVG